ncbi:hypothetical protein H257_11965 [Aphanomyces astaci]|uniref:Uncharacterized protein n=1 Tax=Aphanomyces astaci TaxID=112090 RepID=W4G0C2_APHAT|nr:hypothetical protein H257_11965 [Aphanomyces astaci]ETV73147.1 hypothetical protein H257_11965 [Aphanomyces astaci]|eukprot:XP_009837352.1 hypothetical protein H257_11965 [Aphanomyces astaci]
MKSTSAFVLAATCLVGATAGGPQHPPQEANLSDTPHSPLDHPRHDHPIRHNDTLEHDHNHTEHDGHSAFDGPFGHHNGTHPHNATEPHGNHTAHPHNATEPHGNHTAHPHNATEPHGNHTDHPHGGPHHHNTSTTKAPTTTASTGATPISVQTGTTSGAASAMVSLVAFALVGLCTLLA